MVGILFFFAFLFFFPPGSFIPWFWQVVNPVGGKGSPNFWMAGPAGAGAGAGEAMRNLYFAHIRWAGCLGPCVSPPAVCISSFFYRVCFGGRLYILGVSGACGLGAFFS